MVEVNHLSSSGQYKNIRFKTSILRSDLSDYSDAYIVVKGTTDLLALAANEIDKAQKNVAFKNNTPFRSCISKINSTLIGNVECQCMISYKIVKLFYDIRKFMELLWRQNC